MAQKSKRMPTNVAQKRAAAIMWIQSEEGRNALNERIREAIKVTGAFRDGLRVDAESLVTPVTL